MKIEDILKRLWDRREAAQTDRERAEIQKKIDDYFLSTKMPGRKRSGREMRDDHKRKTKRDREYI